MSTSPAIAGRPPRILVVDDERDNRDLLDVILAWEGFRILTAANGEDALAAVARDPPDLILLDVMMPGMDGYQVTVKLKGDLSTRDIPVIIVTALGERGARARSVTTGAEDFLSKPVDRDELIGRVKSLLRKTYPEYSDN